MGRTSSTRWQQFADTYAPLVFLVVLSVGLSVTTSRFATGDNLLNIARQHSIIIVLAIGQTLVMISGGIDLSVGSVMALSGVVAAQATRAGLPIGFSLAAGLLTGGICGCINGLVASKARVPAFIATLGMMGIARGAALYVSGGINVDLPAAAMEWIGAHSNLLAVVFVAMMVGVAGGSHVLLNRTVLGKHNYAIGGNREAARLSGINIDAHLITIFVINGLIAGLAGLMMLGYIQVGDPTAGDGYELDSVAAAVIGGTSLFGGRGTVGGTVVGGFILAVLRNGCNLRNIEVDRQKIVVGLMTILAVFYDRVRRRQ